jgi:predicted acetyltransferase
MSNVVNALPPDEQSRSALASENLRYGLVDTDNVDEHGRWVQADNRGFHFTRMSKEELADFSPGVAFRRTIGVWDDTAAEPLNPIGTVSSWRAAMSLPHGASIDGWAISSVSVAPTHRRRGIARALLEGELRATHDLGLPLAMLTVSEATIYGRWGFGPAVWASDHRIDTRGLRWTGPNPQGRVQQVSNEAARELAPMLADQAHHRVAGEVAAWPHFWDRTFAVTPRTRNQESRLRSARYDDAGGEPRGFVLYSLTDDPDDFANHTVTVEYLSAATDDAYAALWKFLLKLDLTSTVVARLRPVEEPVQWMIANPRALRTTARRDHLWVRILDVATTLTARRYSGADRVVLRVADALGYANGDWMLETAPDGTATVARATSEPDRETAVVSLDVATLGTLLLGGAPVDSLAQSGALREERPGSANRVDTLFRTTRAPHLSIWF